MSEESLARILAKVNEALDVFQKRTEKLSPLEVAMKSKLLVARGELGELSKLAFPRDGRGGEATF